jgi:hypothetical protein
VQALELRLTGDHGEAIEGAEFRGVIGVEQVITHDIPNLGHFPVPNRTDPKSANNLIPSW